MSEKQLEYEEFTYPEDFVDEDEAERTPLPPPFQASKILYCATILYLFAGTVIPFLDMLSRGGAKAGTFIEMMEWNAFTQLGLILFIHGCFFFWLGLMTDRRGA